MPFVRYVPRFHPRPCPPTATFWARGHIGLNRGAVAAYQLRDYRYAVLWYDLATGRIGFQWTQDAQEPGAITLTQHPTGASVLARAFLEYYRIPYHPRRTFRLAVDPESGLVILALHTAVAVAAAD
jgi:hypothetical protein